MEQALREARLGPWLADLPDGLNTHLDHATANELAEEILRGPRRRSVVWITHDAIGLDLVDDVIEVQREPSRSDRDAMTRPSRRTS